MSFFTRELLISLVTSFIASCAFAIVFQTNKRHLLKVGLAGFIAYFVFYFVKYFFSSLFLAAFLSSLIIAFYGEICARISHAPTLIFIVAGLIPTVPGGDSYYSMKYLIMGEKSLALSKLIDTGTVAIGLASGIVCTSIIFGTIRDKILEIRRKRNK
jgi:uncharacterized membrane protein YjjB (DUF3815 family)